MLNNDKRRRAQNLMNLYYGGIPDMSEVKTKILKKTVTATTSASGALDAGLDIETQYILSTRCTSRTNAFAFHRGDGYLTVFNIVNDVMTVLKNTEVTFDIYYCNA